MNIIDPSTLNIYQGIPVAKAGTTVAIDTEFFGMTKTRLHRPHGKFAGMGCTFDGKTVYIITNEESIPEFMRSIEPALHVYFNAKFDIGQIRRYCEYPDRKLMWDCMVAEQSMYAGWYAKNEFALNDLARRYLDVYMAKDVREQFETSDTMSREQIEYLAVDVVATWRVYQEQMKRADENDISVFQNIDRGAIYSVLRMAGMKMDTDAWMKLYEFNLAEAESIRIRYPEINLGSWQQVSKELKKLGYTDLGGTNEKALTPILEECEFARDVLEYRGRKKAAGTYGKDFMDEHVEADGRVYSDFYINGTECMPAGELVLTNRGYLPVEKVKVGDLVITHRGNTKSVVGTVDNGAKKIVAVSLANGLSLRTTENHPYLLKNNTWVLAKNLKPQDSVVIHSEEERFVTIQGWYDFCVSSWGRVYNQKTGRFLSFQPKGKWGHLKVTLSRNGTKVRGEDRKDFSVHRLVADAFVPGKSETNKEVRHLNGIAWDNTDQNLCWGTSLENRQDAVQHGTMSHRYTSSQTKINESMVAVIRQPSQYYRGRDSILADEFGVSREMVRDIRLGKRWQDNYFEGKEKKATFYSEKVLEVLYDGTEFTYGLEIQDDHSHVTGGIVTHNTGRFSSSKPNVENIPQKDGPHFRKSFIAQPGYVLVDADFSAQEPRIWTYLSDDELLLEIFQNHKDIYISAAKLMFDWDLTKADPRRNKRMKPTVLGAIFGLTQYGLLQKDQIPLEEGEELLDAFWKAFPTSNEYRNNIRKSKNFVQTIYGRKFWLNPYQFGYENNCLNAPVQGSAADIIKLAGYRFQLAVDKAGYNNHVWLINYIHDELLVECREDLKDWTIETLRRIMLKTAEETHDGVPADIEIGYGENWSEAHT